MPRLKPVRSTRVFIRQWLAQLLGVSVESVSRWIGLGYLTSYEPDAVRAFLSKNPKLIAETGRVRRYRIDKGRRRGKADKKTSSRSRTSGRTASRASKPARKGGRTARR